MSRRALFREVNAKICEIDATFGTTGSVYHVLCECGQVECYERFEIPAPLYDELLASERRFAVASGHQRGETIVSSGLRFTVVDSSSARDDAVARFVTPRTAFADPA